ncbi:ankyrin repeat and SOCS box protein 11 isoform X4 [Chrysemys picta bellii]|uniref:ankyrin repeat and SOCS box protein 11 isoform X4 n=1 Tax=Chrysemys picta bellii TaxID=8478 RepID=UPI0032B220D6
MEGNSILHAFNNIYFAIFALFCFKLLIKISLALLTHFYIVKGNRKEAARIAEEIYGIAPGSWADRSPLHEAAFQGRLLSLKTLIAQGFNVNIVTIDRVSALHEACLGGHVACAKVLLENGAQVNAVTVDGITPLFNACCSGSAACVNMLLEFGATPQLENHLASPIHEAVKRGASVDLGKRLDTPLHAAVRKSSAEAVNLLTDYGASLTRRNAEFKCALDLAAPNSKVEQALLLREASFLNCGPQNWTQHSSSGHTSAKYRGPASLAQLCRLCIRKCLGRSCLYVVHKLNLPEPLEKFLLYR